MLQKSCKLSAPSDAVSLRLRFSDAGEKSRAAKRGGVSKGGGVSQFGLVLLRGFSRFVLFLLLGLLRAPTRNSPERVRDTILTFPKKSGKPPGLEPPGLASLKKSQ